MSGWLRSQTTQVPKLTIPLNEHLSVVAESSARIISMNDHALSVIRNFRRIDALLATAGQPTEEQLQAVAASGFRSIINLALPTSTGALPDERASVTALGMEYVNIPVDFGSPTATDFTRFASELAARPGQTVFIHCAANWRVSAFMALYRVKKLGWDRGTAFADLHQVWKPDEVWSRFLDEQLK